MGMLYTYLWTFFLFAFLGWCSEVVFAAIRQRRFVNRGFLNGPLCPIYGIGVVAIDFLLRPFQGNLPVLLVGGMLLGSALEYLAGFFLEKLFHQKWWDYSDQPHNLHGYICLKFSILWGVAGALIIRYITPFTHKVFSRIPTPVGWILLAVLGGLLLADFLATAIGLVGLNRKLKNLQYVTGKLRQGSDKLGADLSKGAIAIDDRRKHFRQILEKDWQREAARLKLKYEKDLQNNLLRRRLLKAFPNLEMLEYNAQLEELRQNVDVLRRRSWEALRKRNEDARAAYEARLAPGEERPFAFGLCFDKLFWIFMTGNVVGFLLETVFALVTTHEFQVRVGLVFGPFIPVYGLGALAILLLPPLVRDSLPLLFPAAALVCTAVEYVTGLFYEKVFRVSFWDYSHLPLNLGGRVCLLFALFWGVLALLVLHVIHPAAAWLAARIPLWAFPPAVLATALDTLLTARLLRRTGDPNSLRWYARLPRRRPA